MAYSKTTIPASYWKRLFALIIDLTIINMFFVFPFRKLLMLLVPPISNFKESSEFIQSNPYISRKLSLIIIVVSLLAWLYLTLTEWNLSATAGDLLMKIKIRSTSGKEIRFWQAALRNLFIFPYFPFIMLWIIDPLYLLFKQQKFSELISRTDTVEEFVINKAKLY